MHGKKKNRLPLLIGLRAAKANFVPGLIVQSVMVALVAAYYMHPAIHAWLSALADVKQRGGFAYSAIAGALAGGVLPETLMIVVFQRGKIRRENWNNVVFSTCYWGFDGILVDAFYRGQNLWFGGHVDVATVVKKVVFDQFVFTPVISIPLSMGSYEWKHQGYSFSGLWRVLTPTYYREKAVPALIGCWGVWIPLVAIIYSLPPLLQFPLFSLGLTFWVMLFSYIAASAQKQKSELSFSVQGGDAPTLQS